MASAKTWEDAQQELSATLRQLRISAGLTGAQLAKRAGMSNSKLSKIERCRIVPTINDVKFLADQLEVDLAIHGHLLNLAQMLKSDAVKIGETDSARSGQRLFMARENDARSLRYCDIQISGLLQVSDYTRALLTKIVRPVQDHVEDIVVDRLRRQALLVDRTRTFDFLLQETALLNPLASAEVMVTQIDRLIEVASAPNVELRIVESGRQAATYIQAVYVILDGEYVIQESMVSDIEIRQPASVTAFIEHFEAAWKTALSDVSVIELLQYHRRRFEQDADGGVLDISEQRSPTAAVRGW